MVDHRDDLVSERTAHSMRLRWHLHDLDAGLEPSARLLNDAAVRRGLSRRLRRYGDGVQVRICRELLNRIGELTRAERELRREIANLVRPMAPALLAISGVGDLVAARILVEVGGVGRFPSDAALARHAGCAPIEVSSGRTARHRLSRLGNRKLNATLHVVVLTQARVHPPARAYLAKKRAEGKSNKEAFRCLKRHLVRVVFRALQEPRLRPGPAPGSASRGPKPGQGQGNRMDSANPVSMLPLVLAFRGLARAVAGVWRDPETKALPFVAAALVVTGRSSTGALRTGPSSRPSTSRW